MRNRATLFAAAALLLCFSASAQFEAGSIVGTVKDPSGLAMPGVVIELRSLATNVSRQSLTSVAGYFDFVAVPPGKYAVTAKRPGFKEITQNFEVAVSQRAELSLTMEVGAASQSVTVEASPISVEAASSDVSNVRTRQQVVDLPLNNRNFTQLVQLAPGVNSIGNSTNATNGGYTAGRGTSGAVVNGNSSDIGLYLFDGIQGVDADANVLVFYPPVDAIQEFKVQTTLRPRRMAAVPRSLMSLSAPARTICTERFTSSCAIPASTPRTTSTLPPTRFRRSA